MRRGIYSSCARRGVSLFRAGRCALSVAREFLFQHTAFMSDLLLNRREVLRKESQRHKWLSAMYAVRKCTLAGNHLRPILESFLHVKDGRLPSMFACAVFVVSKNHVSSSVCVLLRTTTSLYPRSFHGAYCGEGGCDRGEISDAESSTSQGQLAALLARLLDFPSLVWFRSPFYPFYFYFLLVFKKKSWVANSPPSVPKILLFASRLVELPTLRSAAEPISNFKMFETEVGPRFILKSAPSKS